LVKLKSIESASIKRAHHLQVQIYVLMVVLIASVVTLLQREGLFAAVKA